MLYVVNSEYLCIQSAAAILAALKYHYGEDCTRFVLDEVEEIESGRDCNIKIKHTDGNELCTCIEDF